MSYNHPLYAKAFEEFGEPIHLPNSNGWLLKRQIPGTDFFDAVNLYPLFTCDDWDQLYADIADLSRSDLVSVALVIDPFSTLDSTELRRCFPDLCNHFKDHYISNITDNAISKHHRYYAKRAINKENIQVEVVDNPPSYLDAWNELYKNLIKRHHINDLRAFSYNSFRYQLKIPTSLVLAGKLYNEVIAMQIWFIKSNVAYNHLFAMSEIGYKTFTSYALYMESFRVLKKTVRYLSLGGASGLDNRTETGLDLFKKGWSNTTKPVFFCGKIINQDLYNRITEEKKVKDKTYFPLYRYGEFK